MSAVFGYKEKTFEKKLKYYVEKCGKKGVEILKAVDIKKNRFCVNFYTLYSRKYV